MKRILFLMTLFISSADADIRGICANAHTNFKFSSISSTLLAARNSFKKAFKKDRLTSKLLSFPPQNYDCLRADEMFAETDEALLTHQYWNKCKQVYNSPFQKFLRKYSLPKDVQQNIKYGRHEMYSLKGYCYKGYMIERVINAARARNCIKKHNLNLLSIPSKYVSRDKSWCEDLLEIYADDARAFYKDPEIGLIGYVQGTKYLTLEEVQQLVKFAEETNFGDWAGWYNWARDKNGKLICLDLEDKSFRGGLSNLRDLLRYKMPDEATIWLKQRITFWDQQEKDPVPLFENTQYDDPDIDFETVKRFYDLSTRL